MSSTVPFCFHFTITPSEKRLYKIKELISEVLMENIKMSVKQLYIIEQLCYKISQYKSHQENQDSSGNVRCMK